jgi:uncharacterized protein YndB with AHSA1/START domain
VYAAWTDPHQIQAWFGPEGMAIETRAIDVRPGGVWRFDMVTPDGKRFGNRMRFLRLEAPTCIEVEHGADQDNDPGWFRMLVTFDEQGDGKTVLTLRQIHPSKAQRQAKLGFGAVEYGAQTLEKLARHLTARSKGLE